MTKGDQKKKTKDTSVDSPQAIALATYLTRVTRANTIKLKMADGEVAPTTPAPSDIEKTSPVVNRQPNTIQSPVDKLTNPKVGDQGENLEVFSDLNAQETDRVDHDDTQNGATASAAIIVDGLHTLDSLQPLDFKSDNPDFKQILQAIDSKLDSILLSNAEWKDGVNNKLKQAEIDITATQTVVNDMKGTVDFMERVAKRTNKQSDGIEQSFQTIFAQIELDRLAALRANALMEERVNALEREQRSYNIRIQGLIPKPAQNLKKLVADTFKSVVPELEATSLEYVAQIKASTKKAADNTALAAGDTGNTQPKDKAPPVIIIARFNDKAVRNKVYALARKNKTKLPKGIIVRDDLIKSDYDSWALAKPQMEAAYTGKKMCRYKHGKLTIDSKMIPIDGLKTLDQRIGEQNEAVKIPIQFVPIPPLEDII